MIPTAADRAPSHPENAPVAPFGSGKNVNSVGSGPDTRTSETGGRAAGSNQQEPTDVTQPKHGLGEPSGRERAGLGGSSDGAAGGGGGGQK